jgi:FkbM family methyltransferase
MSLIERDGWFVPEADRVCFGIVRREVNDLQEMLPLCKRFRRAVQAGGNVGIWPAELSKHFDNVVTFEPDTANYEALEKNMAKHANVRIYNLALGEGDGTGSMDHIDPGNIGAHQIKDGDDFRIVSIDSFNFADVDFLQLDVEGFEHFAIQGALSTIQRSWPVICLELKGIGERYGHPDADTIALLESIGYTIHSRIHRDIVFVRA